MARHLAPFSCRQTIAEMVRRRSFGCVLPLGRHASTNGSKLIQCASVSIAPPPLSRGAKRPQPHPVQARTGPRETHGEPVSSEAINRKSPPRDHDTLEDIVKLVRIALLGSAAGLCAVARA